MDIVILFTQVPSAFYVFDAWGRGSQQCDVLGHGRRLPDTREGDVLLIATAGVYGRSMASGYNLRPLASKIVLD